LDDFDARHEEVSTDTDDFAARQDEIGVEGGKIDREGGKRRCETGKKEKRRRPYFVTPKMLTGVGLTSWRRHPKLGALKLGLLERDIFIGLRPGLSW
jgi:hypothetical protein